MKTLPAGIPVSDVITRPLWLLTLAFPSGTVRYSSRETVTISSVTYTAAGFTVTRWQPDGRGQARAEVAIPSHDGALRALILNEAWRGAAATLGIIYGESGWISSDIVPMLDGTMDSAPPSGNIVNISLVSTRHGTEFSPRHFARPATFNHIPPPGATVTWGSQTSALDK